MGVDHAPPPEVVLCVDSIVTCVYLSKMPIYVDFPNKQEYFGWGEGFLGGGLGLSHEIISNDIICINTETNIRISVDFVAYL